MTETISRIKQQVKSILLFSVLLCIVSQPVFAKKLIISPVMTAPAIAAAGSEFDVVIINSNPFSVESIVLRDHENVQEERTIEFKPQDADGLLNISVTLPEDIAEGMYDLCVTIESDEKTSDECTPKSVAVFEGRKERFRFAVFSDYHVGDNRGEARNPGIPLEELRALGVKALNESNPDFVIMTGDILVNPSSYAIDYPIAYEEIMNGIEAPVFVVPGNHDLHSNGDSKYFDGDYYWKKTFTQFHMAFTFGKYRFIGFNSFNWAKEYRDETNTELIENAGAGSAGIMGEKEFSWLKNQIAYAKDNDLEPVLFAHHPPSSFSSFTGDEEFKIIPRDEFVDYLVNAGVKFYFSGHTHRNYFQNISGLTVVSSGTVSSGFHNNEGWTFRIIDADNSGRFDIRVLDFWHSVETILEMYKGK